MSHYEELEERISMLEFRQQLLFDNDDVSRILFEYKITSQQYRSIMDIMDKYREKIDKRIGVNHHEFEEELYEIVPQRRGDYHFCEFLARAFMDTGRWAEVFPALYGDMPKYQHLMEGYDE